MTSGSSSLRKKAAKASPVFPCPRVSQRMLIYHQWVYGLTFDSEYFHLWFRASTAVRADTHTTQSRWVSSKWILCFLDSWTGSGVSNSPRDNEQTPFALGSHGNHVSFSQGSWTQRPLVSSQICSWWRQRKRLGAVLLRAKLLSDPGSPPAPEVFRSRKNEEWVSWDGNFDLWRCRKSSPLTLLIVFLEWVIG